MPVYNKPFFHLLENCFIILLNKLNYDDAYNIFSEIMCLGLQQSYGKILNKGEPKVFMDLVRNRDKNVGLNVDFFEIDENQFIYRLLTDPMPNLKKYISYQKLDAIYMNFKVLYILGENWAYKTTTHIWNGDNYIEHLITKQF